MVRKVNGWVKVVVNCCQCESFELFRLRDSVLDLGFDSDVLTFQTASFRVLVATSRIAKDLK